MSVPAAPKDNPIPADSDADGDATARRKPTTNAATGASAAGMRALSAQAVAFYFRAPAKAFFRTRVDYMALAKAINPRVATGGWSWHTTTPGLLAHAVRTYGWRFLPDQVLPPLVANVGIAAVLYTSYLQILGSLHEPSLQASKRVYPPPSFEVTLAAGFAAGTIQSVVAAPLDALQARSNTKDMLQGEHRNVWQYGRNKLMEIGVRGVLSGYGLSFLKDSLGSALFFSVFETVKSQAFYAFVSNYYGSLNPPPLTATGQIPSIQPHYALEPCFLMVAGLAASVAQQAIHHPLTIIQNRYYERIDEIDRLARLDNRGRRRMLRAHYEAYQELAQRCRDSAGRAGGWRIWLYGGFLSQAIRQVPSTSAGLVIFELARRKYGAVSEAVHIEKDGYSIVLL